MLALLFAIRLSGTNFINTILIGNDCMYQTIHILRLLEYVT